MSLPPLNHPHSWCHTQSGMACENCGAVITQAEISANKVAGAPLDPTYIYKKAGH